MTFFERFAVLYGRKPVSVERIRTAVQQVAADKPDEHACWVEYRDRRLEARHG